MSDAAPIFVPMPKAPKRPPNVALCIPSGDSVKADFCMALRALSPQGVGGLAVVNGKSSIVANARNMCIDGARQAFAAQGQECDYAMFFDSDMIFPPETLVRLLSHQKDIVGAVYHRRAAPFDIMARTLDGKPKEVTSGLEEMAAVPTGVLLINMKVFDKFKKPYFRFRVNEESGENDGEDFLFCEMARAAGFSVWADFDLSMRIGHIGQWVFTPPDIQEAARQKAALGLVPTSAMTPAGGPKEKAA